MPLHKTTGETMQRWHIFSRHCLHRLLRFWCSQIALPPHSLHSSLRIWCWQMLFPPHSLHRVLCFPCSQKQLPAHCLHWFLRFWCWQMLFPPHCLHALRGIWCLQMPFPPHCLHTNRFFPCSQNEWEEQTLQLDLTLKCGHCFFLMIRATTPGCVLAIATLVRLRDISSFSTTDIKPVFTRVPCANNPSKKNRSTILLETILKIAPKKFFACILWRK